MDYFFTSTSKMISTKKNRRTFLSDLASAVTLLCAGGSCRNELDEEKEIAQLDDLDLTDIDLTSNIKTIYPLEIPREFPSLSSELYQNALHGDDSYLTREIPTGNGINIQSKINLSNYLALRSRDHRVSSPLEYGNFLTPHPTITDIARVLTKDCQSPEEAAQRILNYVHNGIVYDVSIEHEKDYVRHPLETLVEGNGDCEDTTLLAAALSRAQKLDFVLVLFGESVAGKRDAHFGYAVAGDFHGTYFKVDDKKYFYAESTGSYWLNNPSTWKIGDFSSDLFHRSIDIFTLHDAPLPNPSKPL